MTADQAFGVVARTLLKDRRVTEAKMFGASGLRVGGKVFAMLYKGRLVVKLPKERVAALAASGEGQPFDPGSGRVMKEWVAVRPEAGGRWRRLAEEARDFVAGGLPTSGRRR